jgi:hypothetical protein
MMVSKWKADDRLVYDGDAIDPHATLACLKGIFDDNKRHAALAKLNGDADVVPANDTPDTLSFRQQADKIRLQRERLALAKESGELILVSIARNRASEAVARLNDALDCEIHGSVDKILDVTGADPKHRVPLTRVIRAYRIKAMTIYAADMSRVATYDDAATLPDPDFTLNDLQIEVTA